MADAHHAREPTDVPQFVKLDINSLCTIIEIKYSPLPV